MAQANTATERSYAAIYAAIRNVPRGRVCSYGGIAQIAKLPGRARLVGTLLRNSPRSMRLPWHRIVQASGRSAFPVGSDPFRTQVARLKREGVRFKSNRVDMRLFGWPERDVELDELLWGQRSR